jgi:hypothetical protein
MQGRHRGNAQQKLNFFFRSQYFSIFRMVLILLTESGIQSDITSYHEHCIHIVHPKAVLTGVQSLHSVMWLHSANVFLIMKFDSRCISFEKELLIIRKPLPFGLDFNNVTCDTSILPTLEMYKFCAQRLNICRQILDFQTFLYLLYHTSWYNTPFWYNSLLLPTHVKKVWIHSAIAKLQ